MQKPRVQPLGQGDPMEKKMATHSSILAWKIPWTEKPGGQQSIEVTKSWTWLSTHNTHPNRYFYILWNYFVVVVHSVRSKFLQPHEVQNARLPCPSPSPRACSKSCSLSQWCHPMISSSFIPFSSCFQSFPTSGSFLMSQFFTSSGQVLELQL